MKGLSAGAITLVLIHVCCAPVSGQGFQPVEARLASVTGRVLFSSGAGKMETPALRGIALAPGSILDSRGGGSAVVALSDGSMVTVQPHSVVTFKDYLQAGSLRELFEITLGQVRVKINHYAGKPNPYRMNSPTASIAVRGTEFSITVANTGRTSVIVYEGQVEVASRSDPSQKALIEKGQGVLITPGFGFQLFTPTGREMDERARTGDRDRVNAKYGAAGSTPAPGAPASSVAQGQDHDQQSPRSQAGTYERYLAGLESLSSLPLLLRYNAVPEAYLDSAENPAYATEFRSPEARLYVLPSLQGLPDSLKDASGLPDSVPADLAVSSQLSAFVPIAHGKLVIGGSATGSYFGNTVTTSSAGGELDTSGLGAVPIAGSSFASGRSISRFYGGSMLLAGAAGLNSFGFQVETLKGTGSLANSTPDPTSPNTAFQDSLTHASVLQTRLTLGFKREIASRHTLGVFARYGFIDAKKQDIFNFQQAVPHPLTQISSPGHSAEIGVRLRGEITPTLYYGLQAAWFGLSLRDGVTTAGVAGSRQRDASHKQSAGLGFGYLLRRGTTLVGDFAFGGSDVTVLHTQSGNGLLPQNGIADNHFASLHAALQQDLGRRYFLLASFVNVWQGNSLNYSVTPDASGDSQPVSDSVFSTSPSFYRSPRHLSDFGGGVKLTKELLAQYVFSTDYGYGSPSHTLMLRYTFRFGKR